MSEAKQPADNQSGGNNGDFELRRFIIRWGIATFWLLVILWFASFWLYVFVLPETPKTPLLGVHFVILVPISFGAHYSFFFLMLLRRERKSKLVGVLEIVRRPLRLKGLANNEPAGASIQVAHSAGPNEID